VVSLTFITIAVVILTFGMISKRVHSSVITPPMFFVGAGLILCESVTGLVTIGGSEPIVHLTGELTLMVVLFIDASRIDMSVLRKNYTLPLRMLGMGLPLAIFFGCLVAIWLFPAFSIWEAAMLATVLAPTDAALGQAVVSSPEVPERIRQTLNVESGLNDGICVPVLFMFAVAAGMIHQSLDHSAIFAILQITLGPLVGVGIGFLGGRIIQMGVRRNWMDDTFQQLSLIALAPLAFAVAEMVEGNGFIAAFVAGLTLGNTTRDVCGKVYEFGEVEGQLLVLLVFLIFGTAMVWPVFGHITWQYLVYALLSLTVIRMSSVAISLIGTRLRWPSYLFLGWFGPRGLASILFAILVVRQSESEIAQEIFQIAMLTVLFSVFLHGFSAWPASKWYARHSRREDLDMAVEKKEVVPLPIRGGSLFK